MQIKNIRVYKIEFCIIIKMVLDYIPCNTDCLGDLLKVCWNVTELKRDDQWDMFMELLDDKFCKQTIKQGKNKGKLCMHKISKKAYDQGIKYCSIHNFYDK